LIAFKGVKVPNCCFDPDLGGFDRFARFAGSPFCRQRCKKVLQIGLVIKMTYPQE